MMKITAGLGSVEDYIPYAEAGADEVFCGYVPAAWQTRWGNYAPLNRREVLYYPVQLGARSELLILRAMRREMGVPVTLTFNAPFYPADSFPLLLEILKQCAADGFSSFIVADPVLLYYLKTRLPDASFRLQTSGELGELNRHILPALQEAGISRIIFHRKLTLSEMASVISFADPTCPPEYEAFLLNEMCHFHGAFCSAWHCDEMLPVCRIPYRLGNLKKVSREAASVLPDPHAPSSASDLLCPSDLFGSDLFEAGAYASQDAGSSYGNISEDAPLLSPLGSSGCGLCALYRLQQIGITHLKLVGRGGRREDLLRDIRAVRRALDLLAGSGSEAAYQKQMRAALFPQGCSGICYYPCRP